MNCSECQTRLPEYASDALDAAEAQQVTEHLATGCPQCTAELKSWQDAWMAIGDSLDPVTPPATVRNELLARIRESQDEIDVQDEPPSILPLEQPSSSSQLIKAIPYIITAAAGLLAGVWFAGLSSQEETPSGFTDKMMGDSAANSEIRFAALELTGEETGVAGHLVLDVVAAQVHIYAFDLEPMEDNKAYWIWLSMQDDQWISVGELKPNEEGNFATVIDLPSAITDFKTIVVTQESLSVLREPRNTHNPEGPELLKGRFVAKK